MKRFTTTSLAVAITLMFATSVFAQDETTKDETAEKEWSPNLLINPSAEAKLGDEWQVGKGQLWDYVESFHNIFPYKGDYFYVTVGTTNITQEIDISPYASFIDSGEAEVKMGAWFVSQQEDARPNCSFKAKFYDENASYVDEGSEGISCGNDSGWIERQAIMTVPPKARMVKFEFQVIQEEDYCWAGGGGYAMDCYTDFDHAYFNIAPHPPTPIIITDDPDCNGNTCGTIWELPAEPDDSQGEIPIDRFRPDTGNLWENPVRFEPSGVFSDSLGIPYDATRFRSGTFQNAMEGFFQIRHACEASWYSGAKDLPWIPANVAGAIEYCVYPDNIPEVVNHLRAVADKLACESGMEVCE